MKRFTRIALMVMLLGFGFGSPSQAEDELDDFIVAGGDDFGFEPFGDFAASGRLVFVPGGLLRDDPSVWEAALVAIDTGNGREVWRAFREEDGESEVFRVAGADSGKASAAGYRSSPFPRPGFPGGKVFVACYAARTGALLWEREFEVDAFFVGTTSSAEMAIHANTVVLQISSERLFDDRWKVVLMFDARSGSPL
jgi:outer membrane protein assembly factor BamB